MKQTLEEAAYDYAAQKTKFRKDVLKEVDADDYISRHSDCMEDFQCGVQWQAKQSPWIIIKERLPETKDKVLVLNRMKHNGGYFISENYYENGDWAAKSAMYYEEIAWMPIPSFDEILEANKDVLKRIKERGE